MIFKKLGDTPLATDHRIKERDTGIKEMNSQIIVARI